MNNLITVFLIWNAIVMLLYGIDKLLAKKRGRRISEFTLLLCAFLFGGIGAMTGMVFFCHKTSKKKFLILIPISLIVGIATMYWVYKIL